MENTARYLHRSPFNAGITLLTLSLLLVFSATCLAVDYRIAPTSPWVQPASFDPQAVPPENGVSSGIYFLLSDHQMTAGKGSDISDYFHAAIKVVTTSGIKDASQISINFDPLYKRVILHKVRIHRNNGHRDQLDPERIKILQRETQLDYQIYDGTRTLNIILDDVRIGDIVEYSYTLRGDNPVFNGIFSGVTDLGWSVPVHRAHTRFLWPKNRPLTIKTHRSTIKPHYREHDGYNEYRWDQTNVPAVLEDRGTPQWYSPFPWVQFSEFPTWESVVDWALPLYAIPKQVSADLRKEIDRIARVSPDKTVQIEEVLHFVQDEIRYMGIEIGHQSHHPSKPSLVLKRRFGDCKDKTLLAYTMLDRLGVEATPALVHTRRAHRTGEFLPTPTAFNHVILKVVHQGRTYWLDPTMTLQRGPLAEIDQPDYGLALLVEKGAKALVKIPQRTLEKAEKIVEDTYNLRQGIGASANYTVKSTHFGRSADRTRRELARNSLQELQKNYLNFYANDHPSIQVRKEMVVDDDPQSNTLVITEFYTIPEIWQKEGETRTRANFNPQDLYSYLVEPKNTVRTMPLGLRHPVHVLQKTRVLLPEQWNVDESNVTVKDPAFTFDMKVDYQDRNLSLDYRYVSQKGHIPAKNVASYKKNIKKVFDESGYYVSSRSPDAPPVATPPAETTQPTSQGPVETSTPNWLLIVLTGVVVLTLLVMVVLLYRYNPPGNPFHLVDSKVQGLGGWLVIVGIGLCLSPVLIVAGAMDLTFIYTLESWQALTSSSSEAYHVLWGPLLIFELVSNGFLIFSALLLIVLFFQKRSSFPRLYLIFLWSSVILAGMDLYLGGLIPAVAKEIPGQEMGRIIRQGFFSMIWTAYILKSERVQATFVRERRKKRKATASGACPKCQGGLISKTVTEGPNEGQAIRVCTNYPDCSYLILLEKG